MKSQTITIEKKRFKLLPEHEYLSLLQDIADLKKILRRRQESAMEARVFFEKLKVQKK